MITKNLVRNLRSEKIDLLNEISELKHSISELNIKRNQLLFEVSKIDRRSDSDFIIDELRDKGEESEPTEFQEYFAEEDDFVNEVREALYSNE